MKDQKFELGDHVRCSVTGFGGVATGYCVYLNGCAQYLVKPRIDKDGKMQDGHWIDDVQLELASTEKAIDPAQPGSAGGPRAEAPPAR